jgi:hypothetical protein
VTCGALALGSTAALAEVPQGDKTPAAPVDQAKLKAERNAVKADAAKMTPEQKAAAKKAKRAARQKEETQIEKAGNIPSGPQKAEAIKKSYDATKNDPKPLPTKADKQKALKEQEKKATGQ